MKKLLLGLLLFAAIIPVRLAAQPPEVLTETLTYSIKGNDTLRMDRYYIPGNAAPGPCLVFMFGGGFFGGERAIPRYISFFEFLARQGITPVSVDYRLTLGGILENDEATTHEFLDALDSAIKTAVEDLFDATNFVLAKHEGWNIDPSRIILCGSSAGAIGVLQAEYERCNRTPVSQALPVDFRYAGVIAFGGALFCNEKPQWKDTPAPIQLFHGDADDSVPYGAMMYDGRGLYGSQYIAGEYRDNGFPYYFYTEKNTGHDIAGRPMDTERMEIMSFINKYVVQRKKLSTDVVVLPEKSGDKKTGDLKMEDFIKANYDLYKWVITHYYKNNPQARR